MALKVYYTYQGTDYPIYPLSAAWNEDGVGWKNSQGYPCNTIRAMATSEKFYQDPIPAQYEVDIIYGSPTCQATIVKSKWFNKYYPIDPDYSVSAGGGAPPPLA